MAVDARTRYTKLMITRSFIQLISQKPFSKITLKEVCTLASINHSTFYRYYKDIFDWKEQLEDQCMRQFKALFEAKNSCGIREELLHVLYDIKSRPELYSMILSSNFESSIIQQFYDFCIDQAQSHSRIFSEKERTSEHIWDYYYIIFGIGGIIELWIKENVRQSPEELADYIVEKLNQIHEFT